VTADEQLSFVTSHPSQTLGEFCYALKEAGNFELLEAIQDACKHPPTRIWAWTAYDDSLQAACCDCGKVLSS